MKIVMPQADPPITVAEKVCHVTPGKWPLGDYVADVEDIEAWQPARNATHSVAGGLARKLTQKVYRNRHGSRFTVSGFTVEQIEAEISNLHNCEPLNREPCQNTYLPENSKTSMSRPGKRVPPFMDSSNILRNTKRANHPTVNREL